MFSSEGFEVFLLELKAHIYFREILVNLAILGPIYSWISERTISLFSIYSYTWPNDLTIDGV